MVLRQCLRPLQFNHDAKKLISGNTSVINNTKIQKQRNCKGHFTPTTTTR